MNCRERVALVKVVPARVARVRAHGQELAAAVAHNHVVDVGAGAAVIWAEADPATGTSGDSEDDWSPGAYAHAGIYWNAWESLTLGVDYRILTLTDVDVGIDTDVDYQQLAFTIGFGF